MDDAVNGVKMAQLYVFTAVEAMIAIVDPDGPSSLPVSAVVWTNPDPVTSFYRLATCQGDAAQQGIAIGPSRHVSD